MDFLPATMALAEAGDGAMEVTETIAEPLAPLARFTDAGLTLHMEPTGMPLLPQLSITTLLALLTGVTVSVVVPVWPAVITSAAGTAAMLKSGVVTEKLAEGEEELEKFWSPEYRA